MQWSASNTCRTGVEMSCHFWKATKSRIWSEIQHLPLPVVMLGMGPHLAVQWSARGAVNYSVKIRPDWNQEEDTAIEAEVRAGVDLNSLSRRTLSRRLQTACLVD
jgi:hypothetical protein